MSHDCCWVQNQLDLDHEHMKALLDGDLSSSRGIEQCSEAAIRLQHCMAAEIHPCEQKLVNSATVIYSVNTVVKQSNRQLVAS